MRALVEESQDLHTDAMRELKPTLSQLAEHHHDVGSGRPPAELVEKMNPDRAALRDRTGLSL